LGGDGLIWRKGQNEPVLAEFTKADHLEASLYKARHVEVFIVYLLVAEGFGFLRDIVELRA
jgi:hypothetical protein